MAADRPSKQKRGAESRRRAAACIAELGWLAGYPDGEHWRQLDGSVLAIDGTRVARARRLARTTLREHRAELAELVADVDRWWTIVDAKLAWCAAPDAPLDMLAHAPPRIARIGRELAAREPTLADAIRAASVAWADEPDELARVLGWLAAHGTIADLPTTIALARLAGDHAAGADALIALLRVDAPDPWQARQALQNLRNRVRGKPAAAVVPARSTERAHEWIDELARRDAATRRRALALLAVTDLAGALAPWAAWERASAGRIERASAFAAGTPTLRRVAANATAILAALDEIRPKLAGAAPLGEVLLDIDLLASPRAAIHHAAIVRLLAALPPAWDAFGRVRMVMHLAFEAAWAEDRRCSWLWDAIAGALERGAPDELLAAWRAAGERTYHCSIEGDLVDKLPKRADLQRLVRIGVRLAAGGPVTGRELDLAAVWLAAGLDDERAYAAVCEVRGAALPTLPPLAIARAALAISEDTPTLIRHSDALFAVCADRAPADVAVFVEHCAARGAGWLVRGALASGRGELLGQLAETLALQPRAQWPAIGSPARPRWVDRYPAALAVALAQLAAVDPDAERTAARRLATDLPDPQALAQEIATLRTRARSASTAKRLANLEARLAAPRLPSPVRLAWLAARLERTACEVGLARLQTAATAGVDERIARVLGPGAAALLAGSDRRTRERGPGAAALLPTSDRRTRELAVALLRLEPRDRALARRLLAARSGPRPWDLRDDPTNRGFLDRLRARGGDPAPWLDDTPHTVVANGATLELALCSDPLEVFAMGAHFQTCLSPSGGNFFSVIANAADINKRVLYARRAGRVVGRCLLAITDTGALLVFNPYCHERIDFAAIVRDFAVALAARMHVVVAPRGTVSTLLARDWYDDGPRDLVGRFAALDTIPDDPAQLAPGTFVERLRAALGRELDDVTLPLVLALPVLERAPQLIVPLAPYVLASSTPAIRIRAAELALRRDPVLADRLLGDHAAAMSFEDNAWPAGEVVARLRPSLALARLRATRAVRRVGDDRADRLAVAGIALAALHRPRQAASLLGLAIDKDAGLAAALAPRLEELERLHGLEPHATRIT